MAEIAVVCGSFSKVGKTSLTMKLVDHLQQTHSVDLFTNETIGQEELKEMNVFASTEVTPDVLVSHPVSLRLANQVVDWIKQSQKLPEDSSTALKRVRDSFYFRHIKQASECYDLVIHTEQGIPVGLGIRYQLHPKATGKKDYPKKTIPKASIDGYNTQTLYYRHWPYLITIEENYNHYLGIADILDKLCQWISNPSLDGSNPNESYVANSEWTAEYIRDEFDINIGVIHPPVDVDEISSYRKPWENRRNGFVSMGRITSSKRQLMIIGIIERLVEWGFDTHLHLTGPVANNDYSRKVVDCAETSDYVTYHGLLDRTDLLELLGENKYGIHGKQNEHFGMAVAEMAAAGMIPYVPKGGGQVEIVESEQLQYCDQNECFEKATAVIGDAELQSELRTNLLENVREYSVSQFQNSIDNVISTL